MGLDTWYFWYIPYHYNCDASLLATPSAKTNVSLVAMFHLYKWLKLFSPLVYSCMYEFNAQKLFILLFCFVCQLLWFILECQCGLNRQDEQSSSRRAGFTFVDSNTRQRPFALAYTQRCATQIVVYRWKGIASLLVYSCLQPRWWNIAS